MTRLLAGVILIAQTAAAHPLDPITLRLEEQAPNRFEVTFASSSAVASRVAMPAPAGCASGAVHRTEEADRVTDSFLILCDGPLPGRTLWVEGLVDVELPAIVTLVFASGAEQRTLLTAQRTTWIVPKNTAEHPGDTFTRALGLGVSHLLEGFDHLLFIVGLVLLVSGWRARLATLTAFTVGHSLTLGFAAISAVRIPTAPVEAGIALSLVVVALEVLRPRGEDSKPRSVGYSAGLAAAFGLLHGLGFVGALRSAGLFGESLPLALAGFNLGVELGQIAVASVAGVVFWAVQRWAVLGFDWLRLASGYAIGGLATLWCVERLLG